MKSQRFRDLAACLVVALLAVAFGPRSAICSQIILDPTDVIGGSGSYGGPGTATGFNQGQFNATQVLDAQTGVVSEPSQSGYWLNNENGPTYGYIVIDLGAPYQLNEIDLFNTHNATYDDRGTGQFTITAANSDVDLGGGNFDLSGTIATLVSGTLLAASGDPITDQAFPVTDTGAYRYIRFDALSSAASGTACCGTFNSGLNEIRFSAVPEPTSVLMLGVGAIGIFTVARRRS